MSSIEKTSTEKPDSRSTSRDAVHIESAEPQLQAPQQHPPGEDAALEILDPDGKLEKRAKLKTDLFILPLLASIYFLAQMGRSDLGNAKVAGLDEDLSLTPDMYSNVASIFIVGYLVFQLPGTLLLRQIGPPLQVRSIAKFSLK